MKKHEHSDCTSRAFRNPKEVLDRAGITSGNAIMLDIGAGTGYLSIAAAEIMGNGSKVYALDSYEGSVKALEKELAGKGIKSVAAINADAVNGIPLQRDSVNICLMSNVVHGFVANGEMESVLKNLNTVLKDDGKLIIIDYKKSWNLLALFGPTRKIRLTPDEVENIVSPYGYILEKCFDAGSFYYGVVFKKTCLQDKFC
jgi:ubiquinone/menaquinone biosynthesis C-methylase UbiE